MERLSEAVRKSLLDPVTLAAMKTSETQHAWMAPADFEVFLRAELPKWAQAVALSGAKLD